MADNTTKDKIVLALDVDSKEKAISLVDELKECVGVYKVGKQLFTSCGPDIVREIIAKGGKVFLDLKYHDIPNTVAKASEEAVKLGVFIFNIHASGGFEMMKRCSDAASKKAEELGIPRPIILAVTMLTSIDQDTFSNELCMQGGVEEHVVRLAKLAQKAGIDGVVASPKEISAIRSACGDEFIILTPGIRPEWAVAQDQKRVMTPKEAVDAGSDYIVIGRPIREASNPKEAALKILAELE